MTTISDLKVHIKTLFPDYWAWLQAKPNALDRLQRLIRQAQSEGWGVQKLVNAVKGLKSFQTFTAGGNDDEPPPEETPPEEEVAPEDPTLPDLPPVDTYPAEDIRDMLRNFLSENELPSSLLGFIENALAQKWSFARIVAELRLTPEYLAAYPEMKLRRENGWAPMSEAEVRSYRSEARRLAMEYFGVNLSNTEISQMLGVRNKSIREYEQDLQTWRDVERWGPAVKQVLASELGYAPDDEMVFRLMHGEIPTPDLLRAYERGLYRGQPAAIGLGIRPEEEADILQQFGIDPAKAFAGYQQIQLEGSRAERMALIEAEISKGINRFPTSPTDALGDTTFATLFRAIQLQDPEALKTLQTRLAREVARWQAGGGVAMSGSGAAVGLLTAGERQRT